MHSSVQKDSVQKAAVWRRSGVGFGMLVLTLVVAAVPLVGQGSEVPSGHVVTGTPTGHTGPATSVYAHTFRHQQASDAIALVRLVLSPTGSVELQPAGNSLVVRDRVARIAHIQRLLGQFDHPLQDLRFEINVLRAGGSSASPVGAGGSGKNTLPADLVARLKDLLRYESYELLARTELSLKEGEAVTYALGDRYSVSFRPGTILADRRMRLQDFEILQRSPESANKSRRLEPHRLVQTHLNLWMDQVFVLAVAQKDGGANDGVLMVAITCRREEPSARER